jgi:hypothetical protein
MLSVHAQNMRNVRLRMRLRCHVNELISGVKLPSVTSAAAVSYLFVRLRLADGVDGGDLREKEYRECQIAQQHLHRALLVVQLMRLQDHGFWLQERPMRRSARPQLSRRHPRQEERRHCREDTDAGNSRDPVATVPDGSISRSRDATLGAGVTLA